MASNCKIPSSLFIGATPPVILPNIPMFFFEEEVLHKALPRKLFDERVVAFTRKRAVGV